MTRKTGTYATLIVRRHCTVLKVGRPVGKREQLDVRDLMAAPGGLRKERLH